MPQFDCDPEDEIKWKDFTVELNKSQTSDIMIAFNTLCAIDRGTSSSNRVGQRAKIHAFDLKVHNVNMVKTDPGGIGEPAEFLTQAYQVELWYDAQCNGTAATAGAVYAADAYGAFPNMDNTSRFFPVWSTGEILFRPTHVPAAAADYRVLLDAPGVQAFIPVPSTCIEYTLRS